MHVVRTYAREHTASAWQNGRAPLEEQGAARIPLVHPLLVGLETPSPFRYALVQPQNG